jgi:two-component system response regulator (stage 0 sporulation protein F)
MILLVDDDSDVRATIRRGLEELGYKTREAKNGAQALDLVGAERLQLVILDYLMPGLDGADTAREIAASIPSFRSSSRPAMPR